MPSPPSKPTSKRRTQPPPGHVRLLAYLPRDLNEKFKAKCHRNGQTVTGRLRLMVEADVSSKRIDKINEFKVQDDDLQQSFSLDMLPRD